MATIKQIANLAGVSRGTVDRVLNNRGRVNAETETKIREIAAMVNFTPNRVGKTLAVRKKNLRLGFLLLNSIGSNPFIDDLLVGVHSKSRELAEYGVLVELRQTRIGEPSRQLAAIDELVALGVSGIAIMPENHPDIAARLLRLSSDGMPVVTVNSDIEGAGRIAYVGSNYRRCGETAAGLMSLITGGAATVGVVTGSRDVLCHSERIAGFTARAAELYPGIAVAATAENHDDDFMSFEVTKTMLRDFPYIDALYLTAGGVYGACRAVSDLGLAGKLRIISFDTVPTTRALVLDGTIAATIDQQPHMQGSLPLDILFGLLGMEQPPQRELLYTDVVVRIAENI